MSSSELTLSKTATATASSVALSVTAGPGNVSTNEIQLLTVDATGGEFTLAFTSPQPGETTATTPPLSYEADASTVQSALEALETIGSGNVSVTGGPGDETGTSPYKIEFTGRYADTNVNQLSASNLSLSGGNPSSAVAVETEREGAGALETCTTVCWREAGGGPGQGTYPGQLNYSNKIAVDNDPASLSYGDVYVVDQRNFRVEKYSADGHFLLMFGGEVDKTTHADVCTAADLATGDRCGAGVSGTAAGHFYSSGESTTWSNENNSSIAIGPGGKVYVGDYQRVQIFAPEGTYEGELGIPDERFVTALAVDAAGNVYERSATYLSLDFSAPPTSQFVGIRKFDSSGNLLGTFDTEAGAEPVLIALDASSDLIVADRNSGNFEYRAFKPDGTLYAAFNQAPPPPSGSGYVPDGIAVDPNINTLYITTGFEGPHAEAIPLPVPGPPLVNDERASDVQPTTATLHAIVDPKGYHTEYHFEYVDQHSYETENGFSSPHTVSTATIDLGLIDRENPVQAAISPLIPGTVYHFRVVAESSEGPTNGADETFRSLDPVSVRDFTTQTVGPAEVELKAELNPNGSAGNYTIEFGEDESYAIGTSGGPLPTSNEFQPVTATFTGLKPDTTYHYHLKAENGYGEVEIPDQTVTTERSTAEEHSAENCPNTILREENGSLELADCRAYERVSPANKDGFGIFPQVEFAPTGEAGLFASTGAFANAVQNELFIQYFSQRTPSGWSTRAAVGAPAGPGYLPQIAETIGENLDRSLFTEIPGVAAEAARGEITSATYYVGNSDGTFHQASPTLEELSGQPRSNCCFTQVRFGQADDLSRLYIGTGNRFLESDPRSDDFESSSITRLYEVSGADTATPQITLAAEVPTGLTGGSCNIDESLGRLGGRLASADGSVLAYTSPIKISSGACGAGAPNPIGLFVRTDTQPAVQVNVAPPSQCSALAPCASGAVSTPLLDSISPDGKRVWFTTTQPLVNADTDTTNDLYMAKMSNGHLEELVQVSSGDPAGASVQGVLGTSTDGSRIAFAATGVLTTVPNTLGESATESADNLYVYNSASNEVHFVAMACSGPELSGSVKDAACPSDLSSETGGQAKNDNPLWQGLGGSGSEVAHLTTEGEYMLFPSYARLTSDDQDNAKDIYRYSFQSNELVRVSIGRNGNDGNGNDNAYPAKIGLNGGNDPRGTADDLGRSLSDNGSVAVFLTKAPLVSKDTNEAVDAYEWEEDGHGTCATQGGCISLVSSGVDRHDIFNAVISTSGRDISFATPRNLVPTDTDGVSDMYDARVDGGFPQPAAPPPCGGPELCRPAATTAPAAPILGTPQFIGPGNATTHLHCAHGRRKVVRHGQPRCVKTHQKKHHKRRHHKGRHRPPARLGSPTPKQGGTK